MTSLDAIEAALARSFDDEHLAVYADALQAIGDPRGEMIAIELKGTPLSLAPRHAELHAAWVRDIPAGVQATTSQGMIHAIVESEVAATALLSGRYRHYLRSLTIEGTHEVARTTLDAISDGPPMPFLVVFDLSKYLGPYRLYDGSRLAAAMPNADLIELGGESFLHGFGHPTCAELQLLGRPLVGPSSWPLVENLSWAFYEGVDQALDDFHALDVPAVKHVRLSGIEWSEDFGNQFFELVARIDLPRHPHEVVLRAPRVDWEVEQLRIAQRRNPTAKFTVPVRYRGMPALPPGVGGPPAQPWPSPEAVAIEHHVIIRINDDIADELSLAQLVQQLELAPAVDADTRAAWTEFWDFLDDIPLVGADSDWLDFPSTLLVTALRGTDVHDAWDDLKTIVMQLASFKRLPEVVSIRQMFG
ncbi:MAG: hypothetical protein QM831_37405 [Kofleriaceae bacterium]